jgi:uncharacterized protein
VKTKIMINRGLMNRWLYLIVLISAAALLAGCAAEEPVDALPEDRNATSGLPVEQVVLNGLTFEMELALTPETRAFGLMERETMADHQGMLFVFPDAAPYPREVSFWMKNCLMPIDVVFISREGVITAIHEMQPPLPGTPDEELVVYPSNGPVQFAIELRGGLAGEIGLEAGDTVDLRADYLLSLAE